MADIKLGVNLAFARKRWPRPEEWLEIAKNRLGLSYIEFCSDLLDPFFIPGGVREKQAAEIREKAATYGMEIVDYCTGLITHCTNLLSDPDPAVKQNAIRWCQEAIRLTSQIGGRGIGGHLDAIRARECENPERYRVCIANVIESLQQLSVLAEQQGQDFILWEQMYNPSEVPYTIDQAEELLQRVNDKGNGVPVHLMIDVGHSCCQNYPHGPQDRNPYAWLERFAPVSPVVHIQQTTAESSHHWPFTEKYNKQGIIRAEKVVEAIEASGSKENYLMLEIFHPLAAAEEQIIEDLAESVEYWREYVKI